MILAIVGSQAISENNPEAWLLIEAMIGRLYHEVIISGGASGIDTVVRDVALSKGYTLFNSRDAEWRTWNGKVWPFVEFTPDIHEWDPPGYGFKARNLDIANECDVLICIRNREFKSYGSGWTADRAEERLGRENVHRFYI